MIIQKAKVGEIAHRRHASDERKSKKSTRACKEAGHPPKYTGRMSVKTREIKISNTASRKDSPLLFLEGEGNSVKTGTSKENLRRKKNK